jgi:AICAR transformylase/IMP cyclohydrolase PurH
LVVLLTGRVKSLHPRLYCGNLAETSQYKINTFLQEGGDRLGSSVTEKLTPGVYSLSPQQKE